MPHPMRVAASPERAVGNSRRHITRNSHNQGDSGDPRLEQFSLFRSACATTRPDNQARSTVAISPELYSFSIQSSASSLCTVASTHRPRNRAQSASTNAREYGIRRTVVNACATVSTLSHLPTRSTTLHRAVPLPACKDPAPDAA